VLLYTSSTAPLVKSSNFRHPLRSCYMSSLTINLLGFLDVHVGQNLHPFNEWKLQFRSKQCVFLGYSHQYKGFKCLDVCTGRIYISRDVIFYENVTPFATLNPNACVRLRVKVELLRSNLYEGDHEGVCTVGQAADNADSSNRAVERLFVEKIQEKQGKWTLRNM
jgi:hypothetical protein